jgi:hypothetical protein
MNCFCKEESFDFKLEADFASDPLYCIKCGCNLDTDEFPLSNKIRAEIGAWLHNYEKIQYEDSMSPSEYIRLHDQHNAIGIRLAEDIQCELGDKYTVEYHSS